MHGKVISYLRQMMSIELLLLRESKESLLGVQSRNGSVERKLVERDV